MALQSGQQRNSLTKAHLATLTESIDLDWILYVRGDRLASWPFVGQTRIRLKEEKKEKKKKKKRIETAALPNKRVRSNDLSIFEEYIKINRVTDFQTSSRVDASLSD